MFDKINIRSYNIRKGVDNMEKDKYDLLIENNGFKLVKGGNKRMNINEQFSKNGWVKGAETAKYYTYYKNIDDTNIKAVEVV